MADLVQFRGQATSQDADGVLSVVASRTVIITKRGATIGSGATSATQTLSNGGLRFAVNDDVMIAGNEATYTSVASITNDTTIVLDKSITTATGDRLVNLGTTDTGVTSPNYDSADSNLSIFSVPDSTATAIVDNKVTTDADGEFGFWYLPGDVFDTSVMDSSNQLGSASQTNADQGGATSELYFGNEDDLANSIAHRFSTKTSWTDLTSKLFQIDNDGVIMFRLTHEGATGGAHFRMGEAESNLNGDGTLIFRTYTQTAAMTQMRVNLEEMAANEGYCLQVRSNFRGNWSVPQVGTLMETQDWGKDTEVRQNLIGLQSQLRLHHVASGGDATGNPTTTLQIAIRGAVVATDLAEGTVTESIAVQGVGPFKANGAGGTFSGTITTGYGVEAKAGNAAGLNNALHIEDGPFKNDGTWSYTENSGVSALNIFNTMSPTISGNVTVASSSFRFLDISPTFTAALSGSGTWLAGGAFRFLNISPTLSSTDTLPWLDMLVVQIRNGSTATITEGVGVRVPTPANASGTITRNRQLYLGAPAGTSTFHMYMQPISTATPLTTLNAMSASGGDMVFVTDSTPDTGNDGLYIFMGGTWMSLTKGSGGTGRFGVATDAAA